MKRLLLILLCLPIIGFGQSWLKTVGNSSSEGFSIIQTNDNGYMIVGTYMDAAYLIKTNGNGIEQWNFTLPQSPSSKFTSFQQTSDGGYIVCGTIRNSTNPTNGSYNDAIVIKFDNNGVEQWRNELDGSTNSCDCIKQNIDDSYTLSGYQNNSPSTPGNWNDDGNYLIKLDQNGNLIWSKRFYNIPGFSFDKTNDGGYIIWGSDSILIKADGFGDESWRRSLNVDGEHDDVDIAIEQTSDGGYIFVGSNLGPNGQWDDKYLVKTDENGIVEWTGPNLSLEYFSSLNHTSDGGYITCGEIDDYGQCYSIGSVIKHDVNGIPEWTYIFTDNYPVCIENISSIQQTSDGGYIACGWGTDANFNERIFIAKFDSQGGISSTIEIPLSLNKKLIKIVDVLGKETMPKSNTPIIKIYDDGTVEKRIVIE